MSLFAVLKAYLVVAPLVMLLNLLPVPLFKWPLNVVMAVWGLGLFVAYTFFV